MDDLKLARKRVAELEVRLLAERASRGDLERERDAFRDALLGERMAHAGTRAAHDAAQRKNERQRAANAALEARCAALVERLAATWARAYTDPSEAA